jgi:hypothetical protein
LNRNRDGPETAATLESDLRAYLSSQTTNAASTFALVEVLKISTRVCPLAHGVAELFGNGSGSTRAPRGAMTSTGFAIALQTVKARSRKQ